MVVVSVMISPPPPDVVFFVTFFETFLMPAAADMLNNKASLLLQKIFPKRISYFFRGANFFPPFFPVSAGGSVKDESDLSEPLVATERQLLDTFPTSGSG
jgi:hypothetical protein